MSFSASDAKADVSPTQLSNVRDRVDEIESLHRTSELTVKGPPADLGGFLRIRMGPLLKEHEGAEADSDADEVERQV